MNRSLRSLFWLIVIFGLAPVLFHLTFYGVPGYLAWPGGKVIAADEAQDVETAPILVAEAEKPKPAPAPKKEAAPSPKPAPKDKSKALFDGKSLGKWKPVQFGGEGEVFVNEQGELEFGFGAVMTGVVWSEETPATLNYEVTLDAKKISGNDFFCGLTLPYKDTHFSFIVGGWGGGLVGISSIDDLDAAENETLSIEGFEADVWHTIRVRVTDEHIEAWINDKNYVDLDVDGRKISMRPGDIELCAPMGIASFQTRAAYKNIHWKPVDPEAVE